jgi:chromosome segregation ATPase
VGPSANVKNVEHLKRLEALLTRFTADVQGVLASADMEIRRTLEELDARLNHWKRTVDKRSEELLQAKSALSYARSLNKGSNVGCVEQELEVNKAKKRLVEAEEKVALVKRWQRQLPEYIKEFEAPARSLSGFTEGELRQAVVHLQSRIAALEAYMNTAPPS